MPSKPRTVPSVTITKEVMAAMRVLAPASKRLKAALGKLDPAKLPSGAAADLLYELRSVSRQVPSLDAPFSDVIVPAIKTLEEHFIQTLAADDATGVQGQMARVQVTPSKVPVIEPEGWPKLYAYIKRTGAFELLNRALNRDAVRERWNAKKQVPGVTVFNAKKVSCTKLGKGN